MDATSICCVAGGGALGACCRYQLGLWAAAWLGRGFPCGTLLVNVLGSFIMGLTVTAIQTRLVPAFPWHALVADGALGALTTFSSFAWESFSLLAKGNISLGLLNIIANIGLSLLAVAAGVQLML